MSGLILVVIVALWGSLLVPALVRKHDTVTEVRSVDRFSYALRILSRRTPYTPGRREVLAQRKPAEARRPVVSPAPAFVAELAVATQTPAERTAARRRAVAAKRRRTVALLTLALALTVGLAVHSGGRWWLTVAISAVLLAMYVTNLRAEAQRQAELKRRRAQARRRAGATAVPARVAAPVRRAAPVSTQAAPAPMPVSAMADGSWAPVPVTLPTYVTKPVVAQPPVEPPAGGWFDGVAAEQRAARFAATSMSGEFYDQMNEDDELFEVDRLDDIVGDIIDRRRAVND